MDFARKIGKSDEQTIVKNIIQKNYKEYKLLPEKSASEKYKEDRRLSNWKRWLNIRQRQCRFLSRATNRSPEELVLNSAERYGSLTEMRKKMSIVASTIDADPIKLQAIEPGFWRTFEFLPTKSQSYDSCDGHKAIEIVPVSIPMTEKERKPKLEVTVRNAIPELILKEKNLAQIDKVKSLWKKSQYLKKQISKADPIIISSVFGKSTSKIKTTDLIEDKDLKRLAIKGQKFNPNPKDRKITIEKSLRKVNSLASSTIKSCPSFKSGNVSSDSTSVLLNVKVTSDKGEEECSNTVIKNIIFTNQMIENKNTITLENTGSLVICYHWREITPSIKPEKTEFTNSFVFDKNPGKILPNQKVSIPIWFVKDSVQFPKMSVEFWCLEAKAKTSVRFIFRIWSVHDSPKDRKAPTVTQNLDTRIRNRFIKEIVDNILQEAYDAYDNDVPPEPPYETFFVERELFESFNQGYYYHRNKINEIREIHSKVDSLCPWDLSLKTLRSKIIDGVKCQTERNELLSKLYVICKSMFRPNCDEISLSPICFKPIVRNFLNCFEKEHTFVIENCFIRVNKDLYWSEFESYDCYEDVEESYVILRKEIFYLRILSRLKEMVGQLCAAVDSERNLRGSKCSYLDQLLICDRTSHCHFPGAIMRKTRIL